jgi:hypothetical protein
MAIKGTSVNFTAAGQIDGIPVTVTCKTTTLTAKTPATGLGPVTVKEVFPTGSCTDTLRGTDTVKTFGTWKLTFVDAANDEGGETSGDMLSITIAKAGVTFVSSRLPTCKVTVAASAPFTFKAAYDDVKKATINVALPTAGTRCTTTPTAKVTATVTLSPSMHDVS